jgi:2-amino-4-hydroxy-6-hydroxymethyldihydropteridine diphosphokinase
MTSGVFIGLGSNLGDRERHIRDAIREMGGHSDVRIVASSSVIETNPIGGPADQPPYLNAVIEIATNLGPDALLDMLQSIEQKHARQRNVQWGPRTLDLDLLLYNDQCIDTDRLIVPHPHMWQRDFVCRPLVEICGPARFEELRARLTRKNPNDHPGAATSAPPRLR